jgi:hypothetical protein
VLPKYLAGSYQRYKSDTNAFTTWLSKTAEACGYTAAKIVGREQSADPNTASTSMPVSAPAAISQTLAEKLHEKAAKKAAKREDKKQPEAALDADFPTAQYAIKTQDLIRQTETVAKKSKVGIPETILYVVERAIEVRRRCTAWFRKTGLDNESTEAYAHFIRILENAVEILRPTGSAPYATAGSVKETRTTNISEELADLNNRFGVLDVEEPKDVDLSEYGWGFVPSYFLLKSHF